MSMPSTGRLISTLNGSGASWRSGGVNALSGQPHFYPGFSEALSPRASRTCFYRLLSENSRQRLFRPPKEGFSKTAHQLHSNILPSPQATRKARSVYGDQIEPSIFFGDRVMRRSPCGFTIPEQDKDDHRGLLFILYPLHHGIEQIPPLGIQGVVYPHYFRLFRVIFLYPSAQLA